MSNHIYADDNVRAAMEKLAADVVVKQSKHKNPVSTAVETAAVLGVPAAVLSQTEGGQKKMNEFIARKTRPAIKKEVAEQVKLKNLLKKIIGRGK